MTDNILSVPTPTKEKGQRSLSVQEAYFTRFIPTWTFPSGMSSEAWRMWAHMQPIASDCKDILSSSIISLEWKISPRDSEMRDELKGTIRHYTRLFERGGEWLDLDWTGLIEWLMNDMHDLPFGAAAEVGRKNDAPEGRVMWIKPLDAGTLYPTLNKNFPVIQYYGNAVQVVNFPAHAIARMYMNPRPELQREGWGMAPPERIYMALEMLARGDVYYAQLLLDVPPAGILDLGDMEKDAALEWISSFRTFVANGGVDGFKVPVLYEHTTDPKFIPFGKVPNDIMFDKITLKYAALVCAAYGMTLNDIGLQASAGGETLAGGIRSEKKTRKTGLARAKKKIKFFFETILPDTLMFEFVDMDDELATALGRARLANATAWGQLIERGVFSRDEARLQTIQDGLVTISVPEKPPAKDDWAEQKQKSAMESKLALQKPAERPGMLGSPQAPSQGGDGEVKKSNFSFLPSKVDEYVNRLITVLLPVLRESISSIKEDEVEVMKSAIVNTVFSGSDDFGLQVLIERTMAERIGQFDLIDLVPEIEQYLMSEGLYPVGVEKRIAELEKRCEVEFPVFLGKAILFNLLNSDVFDEKVVEEAKERIDRSLDQYVYSFVQIGVSDMVEEIRRNDLEIPAQMKIKGLVTKSGNMFTVEGSQITMPPVNVTVPERSVHVDPAVLNFTQGNVDVHVPGQEAPVVNITTPEQEPPNVTVNVPPADVHVDAPVINMSVPDMPAPNVVIENRVDPTPVNVVNEVTVQPADVTIPKAKQEVQSVHRDINGNIDMTVTDIKYDEDK